MEAKSIAGLNKILKDLDTIEKNDSKKETEKISFMCRICECAEYEGVYQANMFTPIGGKIYPSSYSCKQCSVVFLDPKKFSKI